MKVHAAMIHRGYVEENAIAGVPVFHAEGFNSVEEFLGALGTAVVSAYWDDREHYRKKVCCDKARAEHPDFKRCPECGNELHRELEEEQGISFCYEFLDGTCDSIGSQWEEIEEAGFEFGPGAFKPLLAVDCVALVYEDGAELLWYCSRGEVAKLSHCDDGGNSSTPYRSVLKDHCEIGLRKGIEAKGAVRLYKE